jgi:hypothetical protein
MSITNFYQPEPAVVRLYDLATLLKRNSMTATDFILAINLQ